MKKCFIPIVLFVILGIICFVKTSNVNYIVGLTGIGVCFSLLQLWFLLEVKKEG